MRFASAGYRTLMVFVREYKTVGYKLYSKPLHDVPLNKVKNVLDALGNNQCLQSPKSGHLFIGLRLLTSS